MSDYASFTCKQLRDQIRKRVNAGRKSDLIEYLHMLDDVKKPRKRKAMEMKNEAPQKNDKQKSND